MSAPDFAVNRRNVVGHDDVLWPMRVRTSPWRGIYRNRRVIRPKSWSTAMEKCLKKSIPSNPRLPS